MTSILATASEPSGVLVALVLIAVAAAGYWVSLKIHPYTACRHCHGAGKDRGEVFVRSFGLCRHCDGTGRTLRLGVRLLGSHRTR